MTFRDIIDRCSAALLVFLTVLFAAKEWGLSVPVFLIRGTTFVTISLLFLNVRITRKAFVLTGIALTSWLVLKGEDWIGVGLRGLDAAAFIAAFFTALSTLRNAAETSPALRRAGSFLAAQPPGRRYAALTAGGHLFALLINYGSISLLGGLASQSARTEPDPVIREIRTRRMLLAIQRGFISSLPWSPLAFAMAITNALIPGATWAASVLPGLGSAAIIIFSGWAMDTLFKPQLSNPPPRAAIEGSWALLTPLFFLLILLSVTVLGIYSAWGLRVVGIVMVVVPAIAIGWAMLQHWAPGAEGSFGPRARHFLYDELPGYRGEIVLLMMAGYIGTVGAPLLQPIVAAFGLHPENLPAWALLALFVWIIPVLGQVGMNPILAVTLIAPLIPAPESIGISPSAMVVAIASGWALSGATSPFTATTLLIGSFGNVSALHVGLRWNGWYFLVTAVLLTAWVCFYGLVL